MQDCFISVRKFSGKIKNLNERRENLIMETKMQNKQDRQAKIAQNKHLIL